MVGSDYEPEDRNGYYCSDYAGIPECVLFSCVESDDAGDDTESGQD